MVMKGDYILGGGHTMEYTDIYLKLITLLMLLQYI